MRKNLIIILTSLIFIIILTMTSALGSFFNNPPNPPIIDGPRTGQVKSAYTYYFTLTDPDPGDFMFNLEVDFGNNVIYENCGCDKSWMNGTIVEVPYQWSRSGDYEISARVQDAYGDWSEWSEAYIVTMPRDKSYNIFSQIINKLIILSPIFEKIHYILFMDI